MARSDELVRRLLIVAGLALSAAMVARAQIGGDQLNLLARGWLWAAAGELVPYGNPLSTGGYGPGAATTVLVGAPLFLWMDPRAPVVLIWLSHLAAFLLLDRALRPHLSDTERLAFVALYWLNPWRLETSAYLWNPNLLFLFGAIHLATALGSRERPSFLLSAGHVLALGVAFQLHPGTLLAATLSFLLWLRGYVRVHWWGVVAGAAATLATLVPWLAALADDPELLATGSGFPFRGLVFLFPMLKGLLYLVRYASLSLNRQTTLFDFSEALGPEIDRWLAPVARGALQLLGAATLLVALVALASFWRGRRPLARWAPSAAATAGRIWLEGYTALAFVAGVLVFAAAPTTPQAWQALVIFHAAILPAVFGTGRLAAAGRSALARRAILAFASLALAADLALAAGGPNFRCGGRGALVFPLRSHSPMFEDLGLQRRCPWPLDVPHTWWPDVLPAGGGSGSGGSEAETPFALGGDAARGEPLFARRCKVCHGPEGKGDGSLAAGLDPPPGDLTDGARMARWSDRRLYELLRDGGPAMGLSPRMIAWGKLATDQELRDMAAFVRTLAPAPPPSTSPVESEEEEGAEGGDEDGGPEGKEEGKDGGVGELEVGAGVRTVESGAQRQEGSASPGPLASTQPAPGPPMPARAASERGGGSGAGSNRIASPRG